MFRKNIIFSSEADLTCKDNRIHYRSKDELVYISLQDVETVVLENPYIRTSNYLLMELAENKATVITCDSRHLPNGVLIPLGQYCRGAKVAIAQCSMTEPFKKKIWQKIIKQKIKNQSSVLKKLTGEGMDYFVGKVLSGDTTNVEAQAARYYWSHLIPNFKRRDEDIINSALNYAYALVRSSLAKNVACSGLVPCLGVHHRSELNNFNLVDDLIEPFRALVDLFVLTSGVYLKDELDKESRLKLLGILTEQVCFKREKFLMSLVCEKVCQSFTKALLSNDVSLLELPEL